MITPDSTVIPPGARVYPLSIDAYHLLGEAGWIPKNTELLYGVVYNKVSKSPFHSAAVMELLSLLQNVVPAGCLVRTEQPIIGVDSEPEPDIAVVRATLDDLRRQHPTTAELVVEVCLTSHDYDRSKLRAYAQAQVTEVWLILAPEKQVEVYRQPENGASAAKSIAGPGGQLASLALPAFSLDLSAFFRA